MGHERYKANPYSLWNKRSYCRDTRSAYLVPAFNPTRKLLPAGAQDRSSVHLPPPNLPFRLVFLHRISNSFLKVFWNFLQILFQTPF